MTSASAAVPSGAAERFVRAAAGRRALQVALLLGGLLLLGFLFGERAQAADGLQVDPVREVQVDPVREVTRAVTKAPEVPAEPVTEATRPVTGALRPVVRPVGEVVHEATGTLRKASAPSELLPERPLPDPGEEPGHGSGAEPEPAPAHEAEPSRDGDSPQKRKREKGQEHRAERPVGPRADSSYAAAGWRPGAVSVHRHVRGGATAGEYGTGHPSLPAPVEPGGSIGNATAGDGSSSRQGHGDLHAAVLGGRAPVRLVSGSGLPPEPAPTRDRHRDIPEFPG